MTTRVLVAAVALLVVVAAAALVLRRREEIPPEQANVVRVVKDFATAEDADGCKLLTDAAVQRIYGTRDGCVRRAKDFRAGTVKVESVTVAESAQQATAQARSINGNERFTVVLERTTPPGCRCEGPSGGWLIREVKPAS